ncbi:hypothetical protein COHA_008296 [Chlorella ohadii]|uniref:Integrase catalytic domain-containing protein n=1 Tax=Chlorella ohadii TaxID=2649997 RepID=A0AAD5DH20_9CHLO|nr:hypothetical protein COHA_008296 [Chlorella ohadii]
MAEAAAQQGPPGVQAEADDAIPAAKAASLAAYMATCNHKTLDGVWLPEKRDAAVEFLRVVAAAAAGGRGSRSSRSSDEQEPSYKLLFSRSQLKTLRNDYKIAEDGRTLLHFTSHERAAPDGQWQVVVTTSEAPQILHDNARSRSIMGFEALKEQVAFKHDTVLVGEDGNPLLNERGVPIVYRGVWGITRNLCREYVRLSEAAQRGKALKPSRRPFHAIRVNKLYERFQVDLLDLGAHISNEFRYVLLVVDRYSRFCWLRPLRTKHSRTIASYPSCSSACMLVVQWQDPVAAAVHSMMTPFCCPCSAVRDLHGVCMPRILHCDNGSEFLAESQGGVERLVRTVGETAGLPRAGAQQQVAQAAAVRAEADQHLTLHCTGWPHAARDHVWPTEQPLRQGAPRAAWLAARGTGPRQAGGQPTDGLPPSLTSLALDSFVDFTSSVQRFVPRQITALTSLRRLTLGNLQGVPSGESFSSLTALSSLTGLELLRCAHLPTCLPRLPQLRALRLSDSPRGVAEGFHPPPGGPAAVELSRVLQQLTAAAAAGQQLRHLVLENLRQLPAELPASGPYLSSLRRLALAAGVAAGNTAVLATMPRLEALVLQCQAAFKTSAEGSDEASVLAWAAQRRPPSLRRLALAFNQFGWESQKYKGMLESLMSGLQLPPSVTVELNNAPAPRAASVLTACVTPFSLM